MRGFLPSVLAGALFGAPILGAQAAGAQELGAEPAAQESVEEFMERYEAALDHGDPGLLSQIYLDWTRTKAQKLQEYFSEIVTEFNVEFTELEVDWVEPDLARVRFMRRDFFTDLDTGRRIKRHKRLDKTLRRVAGRWKVAPTQD